jgi:hypothetical protein
MVRSYLGIILAMILLVSCAQSSRKETWTQGMQGMTQAFKDLLPYIYNDRLYSHPRNKTIILTKLTELNHYSSSLDQHVAQTLSGKDPLLDLGLAGLKRSIEQSLDSFQVDNHSYSQNLAQSAVHYCVQCHLRNNTGRSFIVYDSFGSGRLQNIDPIHLAQAQMAMREFTQARQTLMTLIENKNEDAAIRKKSLELLLSISIRFQNDLKTAYDDLKSLRSHFLLTSTQAQDWLSWQTYLKNKSQTKESSWAWANGVSELQKAPPQSKYLTRDLHISQTLHTSLSALEIPSERAQVFAALAQIYQVHSGFSQWELPERYYEACIKAAAHSPLAKKCYYSLESNLRKNRQVPTGGSLPASDVKFLNQLKILTGPAPKRNPQAPGSYELF